MNYLSFVEPMRQTYKVCLLVPHIMRSEIEKHYFKPYGVNKNDFLALSLHYSQTAKKTPAAEMKEYFIQEVMPVLDDYGVEYIAVADSEYFKVLTKSQKVEANLGYVLDCVFGNFKVVYIPNYRAVFYDPDKVNAKIKQGIEALENHRNSSYVDPGVGIIHHEEYPKTYHEIRKFLERLLTMDCDLAIDIEAFDLKHTKAGIGTISFAWNQHCGGAFCVDYEPIEGATTAPFGREVRNEPVRGLLQEFFMAYLKKAIYHNIAYDVYNLIYQLFMTDILDTKGLLDGIEIMLRNWDDTKLITYLATNSCAGNKLGLKDQSQEFAGNYAQDEIHDITRIRVEDLLRYNLVDSLSTWFVHKKHWDTMVADKQLEIYETLFKPATIDIIQMQLTGLPVNMQTVKEVKAVMQADLDSSIQRMQATQTVQRFTYWLNEEWVEWKNSTLKKKRVTLADAREVFNPNSNPQLQKLLYEMLGLPVIALTDSKQPSTDGDTIKALRNHTQSDDVLDFLNALIDYASVNIILANFIPALENAALGPDGWHYLFGNFNLGGTVSGRLSSSNPNLQNLPASSKYAKLIKKCIEAPEGWLFCGLDFASLEDRISALTTKDPNKLKVYTDGYDGHSLRAFAYFGDQMPLIRQCDGTKKVYSIEQNGAKLWVFEDDVLELSDGKAVTVAEYVTTLPTR